MSDLDNVWEQGPEDFKLPWPKKTPVYVDVDGTLILWPGDNPGRLPRKPTELGFGVAPIVNYDLLLKLRKLYKTGKYEIYVWSWGGAEHARNMVKLARIEDIVSGCLTKPFIVFDDNWDWINAMKKITIEHK